MSCGLFNLPIASDRLRAVFLFGWIVSTLPPSGHGAILQATLRIRGNVIRSQDDWEFAGPDDAKAEIRAAVGYLLEVLPAAPAVISCRRSLRSCARSRAGCRLSSRITSRMVCPVDETQERKPPLGANQRRLSLRHRDHQTVMTSNKHYRWKVMTRMSRDD